MARPAERRTPTTEEFGRRVRSHRQGLGFTQEDLAYATGLSVTYVASIERGERSVGLTKLLVVADALRVTPGRLVDDLPRV